MAFTLHIDTGNAAFYGPDNDGGERFVPEPELSRILSKLAGELQDYGNTSGTLRDVNGKRVGSWKITGEDN